MFLRGGNGLNRSFTKKYQVMQSDIILFVKSFKYMHKRGDGSYCCSPIFFRQRTRMPRNCEGLFIHCDATLAYAQFDFSAFKLEQITAANADKEFWKLFYGTLLAISIEM